MNGIVVSELRMYLPDCNKCVTLFVYFQVWDENGVSKCFDNIYPLFVVSVVNVNTNKVIVMSFTMLIFSLTMISTILGFGVNIVSVVVVAVLGITKRNAKGSRRVSY